MHTHHAQAERKRIFLEAMSRLGNIHAVTRETGISRSSHYDWIHADPAYAAAFHEAEAEAIEAMEAEARRRAVEGTQRPVFGKNGALYGHVTEYSDQLLMFLLKAARPERYRERVDLTVDIRREAQRLAEAAGLGDADAVIAEAERLLAEARAAG